MLLILGETLHFVLRPTLATLLQDSPAESTVILGLQILRGAGVEFCSHRRR
jgi:hypothetical protein